MAKKSQITIIGGGTMGTAIAQALLRRRLVTKKSLLIIDTKTRRPKKLHGIIFLCVKPQDAAVMMREWTARIDPQSIVISIMAGVRVRNIQKGLHVKKVVRAMPNTPVLVGEGMTVWKAAGLVTKSERAICATLFRAFGQEMEVASERLIDIATAVSGSGPAYVFHFAEHLIHAARGLGLSQQRAQLLVTQTLLGAALLMQQSQDDPATLRARVTSTKGTTAAALDVLQHIDFKKIYSAALTAAYKRAKKLSK